jgi:phosphatidylserine synthase 2
VFVFAHALGWWGKALVVRDARLLWVMSLAFEFAEIFFRPWLPNFNECWWDHLFYDVFGMNMLGIHFGLWCADKWGMDVFDWHTTGATKKLSYGGLRPSFAPPCWTRRWFMANVAIVFLATFLDLNYFFLKHQLHIPVAHWTMVVRAFSVCGLAAPALKAFHGTMHNEKATGPMLQVSTVVMVTLIVAELGLAVRFALSRTSGFSVVFTQPMKGRLQLALALLLGVVLYSRRLSTDGTASTAKKVVKKSATKETEVKSPRPRSPRPGKKDA